MLLADILLFGLTNTVKELDKVKQRIRNPKSLLEDISILLLASISKNFQDGGRPIKWEVSARAERDRRKGTSAKTLLNTRRLQRSIKSRVSGKTLEIGTNVVYAAIHNYGFNKTVSIPAHTRVLKKNTQTAKVGKKTFYPIARVKAHSRDMKMPKREFMLIQAKDWYIIKKISADYLVD